MDPREKKRRGFGIATALLVAACTLLVLGGGLQAGRAAAGPHQQVDNARSSCGEASWEIVPSPNYTGTSNVLKDIASAAPNYAWAVGNYSTSSVIGALIERWDGANWSLVHGGIPDSFLYGVTAISPDDAWAVGGQGSASLAMHWDGDTWTVAATPNISTTSEGLFDVSAVSSDDVWAVGRMGNDMPGAPLILHWDGTSWTSAKAASQDIPENFPTRLYSVDALSSDDVWAVGIREAITHTSLPLIMHYDGEEWTQLTLSHDFGDLHAVEAIAPDDVWAVGVEWDSSLGHGVSRTIHWDGQTWSVIPSPDPPNTEGCVLYGVSAESSNRIWAVGECFTTRDPYASATLVMSWDGTQWSVVESPSVIGAQYNRLSSVAVAQPGDVLAVGHSGEYPSYSTLAERYYDPSCSPTSTPVPPPPTTVPTSTSVPPTNTSVPPASTNTPAPTATATSCGVTFSDVPSDHTFYPYVHCLACQGIISGYDDGTFRPFNDITRGQIAKIVSSAAGIEDDPGAQMYEDVDSNNPFYVGINRLSNRGYMSGYPCGGPDEPCGADDKPYFRPFGNATRAQIAKIVSNTVGIEDDPGPQIFDDVLPDNPFYLWVQRVTNRGIMVGYQCGGPGEPCDAGNRPWFRVYHNATRGQTAKITANAFFPDCTSR